MESEGVSRIPGSYQTYEEAVWTRRGTWGSVVGGALVGLAITLILGTLGLAAGLVGGGVAADRETGARDRSKAEMVRTQDPASEPSQETKDAAKKAAVAGGLWLIVTAILSGLLGGWVAGRVAQVFRSDVKLLGVLTWAVGVVMLYALASLGSGALGAGLGAVTGRGGDVDPDTGARAAIAAGSVLWALVAAHGIGLLSSLLGAWIGMKRRMKLYPAGSVPDRQQGRDFPMPQPGNP